MQKPFLVGVAMAVAATSAAFAHHSPSAFDMTREIVVEGTLAKVDWANPHIYLTIETRGAEGRPILQQVESVSIPAAQSLGLKREYLVLGSTVSVRAYPNRAGSGRTVMGADITITGGDTYALGRGGRSSRPPVATVPAVGLAGTWAPKSDPRLERTVQGWPLTEKGRAALTAVMTGKAPTTVGCAALPVPMLMELPQMRTIETRDDRVLLTIDSDGVDAARTVYLGLAEHPRNVEPSLLGHSIGRWEGGTLVIDTVAFTPHPLGVGFGVPAGSGKHLVERLALTDDRLQLRYELTLEDPEYLAAPATYAALWDHRPDLTPSSAACDREIAERYREN